MSAPGPSAARASVYLDWNATTPPHPDVLDAMSEAARSGWANPSSVHGLGRRARALVEDARVAVAELVGREPRDVVFTSGGTEANNLALSGAVAIVTSRLEHPSIVRVAEHAERRGVAVRWLSVSQHGAVEPNDVARILGELPAGTLVALSAVNHETGVILPLRELDALVSSAGGILHVDAVQAAGRVPPEVWQWGTTLSIAGHKLRGPKGTGALVGRPGHSVTPALRGGSQERGIRPGTLDPVALAGFGVAAARAVTTPERYAALSPLRDHLEMALERFGRVNGAGAPRAPHVTNVSFDGVRADELAAALDLEGICVSSGSACSAGTHEPSPVVAAMLGPERARSALRVSMGEETSADDVKRLLAVLPPVLERFSTASSGA